jgi:ABC-type multidrug transport system fused ATPase/permease subunit
MVMSRKKITLMYCRLGMRLESMGTTTVTLSALFSVLARHHIGPGLAGLSLSSAIRFAGLGEKVVRILTDTESIMISVERVLSFTKLQKEALAIVESNRPTGQFFSLLSIANCVVDIWPSKGEIEFKDVQLRYRPGLDMVLKGVSFKIQPHERIGVCGRTGAGKSSLMLALFRIVELAEGSITIGKLLIFE